MGQVFIVETMVCSQSLRIVSYIVPYGPCLDNMCGRLKQSGFIIQAQCALHQRSPTSLAFSEKFVEICHWTFQPYNFAVFGTSSKLVAFAIGHWAVGTVRALCKSAAPLQCTEYQTTQFSLSNEQASFVHALCQILQPPRRTWHY